MSSRGAAHALQALEDAAPRRVPALTEGSGRWRWRRASGSVIAEHHPELAAGDAELASRLTALEAHRRTLDEQLFQCKSTLVQAEAAALRRAPCRRSWLPSRRWRSLAAAL